MSLCILRTFKGYTVDMRLREFRKAIRHVVFEIIPFNGAKGKELVGELKEFAAPVIEIRPDEWQGNSEGLVAMPALFLCFTFLEMYLTVLPFFNLTPPVKCWMSHLDGKKGAT